MNDSTRNTRSSIGFPSLLTLTFIVLKLTHVIAWSWWWVLAPAWTPLALLIVFLLLVGVAKLTIFMF